MSKNLDRASIASLGSQMDAPKLSPNFHKIQKRILEKIKEREKEIRINTNRISMIKRRGALDLKGFVKLIRFVKMYYFMRRVNNMYFVKVIEHVNAKFLPPLSIQEAKNALRSVVKGLPKWMIFVDLPSGVILRVLKKISLKDLEIGFKRFYPELIRETKE